MADDLDQLLDEVESRFCRTNEASNTDTNPRRAPKARSQPNRTSNASVAASKHDDIDGLIQDLFEDVNFDEELVTPKIKTSHQSFAKCSHMQSKKCCPVYLGGSSAPSGLGTTSSQRNSMPELDKLKGKLMRRKGFRAYACQCSWRSIQQLTELQADPQLRWVCGKHAE
ncbi:cilia- and flagella-associated protein 418 isoform X4 [Ambystoma mexicanum]|uniref:cilia- and flagella-associated protein 418 isoform X4 n=1 Tax=Ambystoma mexicanum TaxID=8296 RepID=UPI0037E9431B